MAKRKSSLAAAAPESTRAISSRSISPTVHPVPVNYPTKPVCSSGGFWFSVPVGLLTYSTISSYSTDRKRCIQTLGQTVICNILSNCVTVVDGYLLAIQTPSKSEAKNAHSYFSGHYLEVWSQHPSFL